jgi:L-asparagine transporter-like permease
MNWFKKKESHKDLDSESRDEGLKASSASNPQVVNEYQLLFAYWVIIAWVNILGLIGIWIASYSYDYKELFDWYGNILAIFLILPTFVLMFSKFNKNSFSTNVKEEEKYKYNLLKLGSVVNLLIFVSACFYLLFNKENAWVLGTIFISEASLLSFVVLTHSLYKGYQWFKKDFLVE